MAIGRTEDRNTPGNPLGRRPRRDVWDPIRVTHLGPRSTRPHTKAGHMTAIDQTPSPAATSPCEAGAVHTRVSDDGPLRHCGEAPGPSSESVQGGRFSKKDLTPSFGSSLRKAVRRAD